MTGRELMIYILANKLEEKPVFENGKFIGYYTLLEAAEHFEVGTETVKAWVKRGMLNGVEVNDEIFVPYYSKVE